MQGDPNQKCYFCNALAMDSRGIVMACCHKCYIKLVKEHKALKRDKRDYVGDTFMVNKGKKCITCYKKPAFCRGLCYKHYMLARLTAKEEWTKKCAIAKLGDGGLVPPTPSVT